MSRAAGWNNPTWRTRPTLPASERLAYGEACCICGLEIGDTKIANLRVGPACVARIRAIAAAAGVEVRL